MARPISRAAPRKDTPAVGARFVEGLPGAAERKNREQLAEEVALGEYDQLHHFLTTEAWDAAPLLALLAEQAQALVGGPGAVLIIDDTSLLKQGSHSVGVGQQYSDQAGKVANCQCLVSLTLARVARTMTWRSLVWRQGTKGPLGRCVRRDAGPRRRWRHAQQRLEGSERRTVARRRAPHRRLGTVLSDESPATPSLAELAQAIKARWSCEQVHQQLKEELGLDHFEGRSWTELHHDTLLTMIAFPFLQHYRFAHAVPAEAATARAPIRAKKEPQQRRGQPPRRSSTASPQPSRGAPSPPDGPR